MPEPVSLVPSAMNQQPLIIDYFVAPLNPLKIGNDSYKLIINQIIKWLRNDILFPASVVQGPELDGLICLTHNLRTPEEQNGTELQSLRMQLASSGASQDQLVVTNEQTKNRAKSNVCRIISKMTPWRQKEFKRRGLRASSR